MKQPIYLEYLLLRTLLTNYLVKKKQDMIDRPFTFLTM